MEEKSLDIGELILAIQAAVCAFTDEQIQLNNLPPSIGCIIMQGAYQKFLETSVQANALSKVSINPPEETEKPESQIVTGTPAELLAAFAQTGFKERKGE